MPHDIILIGSHALNHHIAGFRAKPADTDLMMTLDTFLAWFKEQPKFLEAYPMSEGKKYFLRRQDHSICEVELIFENTSASKLLELLKPNAQRNDNGFIIPSLDVLYTIKCSHKYLKNSTHFEKTMSDYHALKSIGCKIFNEEWLKQREAETYIYRHPSLKKSKQNFFSSDGVNYIYDHDSLHEAVKLQERPAYAYFKPQDSEVMVCRKLWNGLHHDVKIKSVLEESYVLALERSQIPYGANIHPYDSFKIALSKVCTSITSGWWREFAYDHYYEVRALYNNDYIDKFNNALQKGIIKAFSGSKY